MNGSVQTTNGLDDDVTHSPDRSMPTTLSTTRATPIAGRRRRSPRRAMVVVARSSGGTTRREGTAFAAFAAFTALTGGAFTGDANAYGTGGWKDCEPVCDALKDGRARQLALQAEMMGAGTSGSSGLAPEDGKEGGATKRERERLEERARIRAEAGEKK